MQYNAKIAKACPHPYYWVAGFVDGEEVAQYTKDGVEVLYREILNRLEAGKGLLFVAWIPTKKDRPLYRQEIDSTWQRPVIFRRHFVKPSTNEHRLMFALGWQATINGKNIKSILYIDLEGSSILITSKDW